MKVLHISTSNKGGAGIAAVRLHKKLLSKGIHSALLTLWKVGDEVIPYHYYINPRKEKKIIQKIKGWFKPFGFFISPTDNAAMHLKGRPEGFEYFSFPISNYDLLKHPLVKSNDIIHLHWMSDEFLDFKSFFKGIDKKIVWTLHDMNPFTGGCHHSDDCTKFEADCFKCPQLANTVNEDYAGEILKMKIKALRSIKDEQMKIVAPSAWMKNRSLSSQVFSRFEHFVIPNIINEDIYCFANKIEVRKELSLPDDKIVILFVSHTVENSRKGINYLLDALQMIEKENILVCTTGSFSQDIPDIEVVNFGYVSDELKMAKIYASADLFVLPSLAENYPNSIAEALLCGTPALAFKVGGIPEQIDEESGIMVPLKNTKKLAEIINSFVKKELKFDSNKVRNIAISKFSSESTVNYYIDIYNKVLK